MTTQAKWKQIGVGLMDGFLSSIGSLAITWIGIILVLWAVCGVFNIGTDDSDISGWKRSGFKIMTDARTGLQYLSDGRGGLTLRVDANGKPVR